MESTTTETVKIEILICLHSMGWERGLGWTVRKGDGTFVNSFKGRNAYKRCCDFYDGYSAAAKAANKAEK